jgi:hypothetical protein
MVSCFQVCVPKYYMLFSPIRATCPAQVTFLDWIILKIVREYSISRSFSICTSPTLLLLLPCLAQQYSSAPSSQNHSSVLTLLKTVIQVKSLQVSGTDTNETNVPYFMHVFLKFNLKFPCVCTEVWDPSRVTADQIFRIFYLIHLAALQEPQSQICGAVVIMDFNGLGMKQVKGLSPAFSLRLLTFIQVRQNGFSWQVYFAHT